MSYGEDRTAVQRRVDQAVLRRVQRGIELLKKEYGADFADHIDPEYFDIQNSDSCILGQLYVDAEVSDEQWEALERISGGRFTTYQTDGYSKGLAILDGDVPSDPSAYGFDREASGEEQSERGDYWALQAAWETELEALRSQ